MSNKNVFATPLVEIAVKMNQFVFNFMYPYPFYMYIKNGIFYCKVDSVLKFKYFPFLLSIFCLTFVTTLGSCLILPVLKLCQPNSTINVISFIFSIFFGSCVFVECATYLVYIKATEIETLINQILLIERKCKFVEKY